MILIGSLAISSSPADAHAQQVSITARPAGEGDRTEVAVSADGHPSIRYGRTRRSEDWVTLQDGTQVAVDQGIEWRGVKVYLSLMWDLVAVDVETGDPLWSADVGAFWNRVAIREIEGPDGPRAVVELRPFEDVRRGSDRVRLHDLRTGERIEMPEESPPGEKIEVRAAHGDRCGVAGPFQLLIGSRRGFEEFTRRAFNGAVPEKLGEIDFEREVLFAKSAGDAWNCAGFVPVSAHEDDGRVLLRIDGRYFQTAGGDGGGVRVRPWGLFVLPRRDKAYVVEQDRQNLIGGPPLFEEVFRVDAIPAPEDELRGLPRDV